MTIRILTAIAAALFALAGGANAQGKPELLWYSQAAFKLTTQDVEDALRRNNLEVPAGRVESQSREFNVTAMTDLQTPEQFRQTINLTDKSNLQRPPATGGGNSGSGSDSSKL